jgi:hypothetical protein
MPLPSCVQKAIRAILSTPGATDISLRRALLDRTRLGCVQVPDNLRNLVDKIAERAWTINDEDFDRVRHAGYSEDQIYEVTMAAALGAGLERFDAGLRAIESNEPQLNKQDMI